MRMTLTSPEDSRDIELSDLPAIIDNTTTLAWIDVTEPDAAFYEMLATTFKFHPLAIEDTQRLNQATKVEEFSDFIFMVLNSINPGDNTHSLENLVIFGRDHYVLSVHRKAESLIADARERFTPERTSFRLTITYLLYLLVDTATDSFFPVLDTLSDTVDELSNDLLTTPEPDTLTQLFQLKRDVNNIERTLYAHENVINKLANQNLVFTRENSQLHLRDVADHTRQLLDISHTLRDTLNSLIHLYVSASSNQINVMVNRLTIVAMVTGVASVVVGFYGMNFVTTVPDYSYSGGIPLVLTLIIVIPATLLLILRWLK